MGCLSPSENVKIQLVADKSFMMNGSAALEVTGTSLLYIHRCVLAMIK